MRLASSRGLDNRVGLSALQHHSTHVQDISVSDQRLVAMHALVRVPSLAAFCEAYGMAFANSRAGASRSLSRANTEMYPVGAKGLWMTVSSTSMAPKLTRNFSLNVMISDNFRRNLHYADSSLPRLLL